MREIETHIAHFFKNLRGGRIGRDDIEPKLERVEQAQKLF
jgi:hypothetical protein